MESSNKVFYKAIFILVCITITHHTPNGLKGYMLEAIWNQSSCPRSVIDLPNVWNNSVIYKITHPWITRDFIIHKESSILVFINSINYIEDYFSKADCPRVDVTLESRHEVKPLPPSCMLTICLHGTKTPESLHLGRCPQNKDSLSQSVGIGLGAQLVISTSLYWKKLENVFSQWETFLNAKHHRTTSMKPNVHRCKGSTKGLSKANLHQWRKLLQMKLDANCNTTLHLKKYFKHFVYSKRTTNSDLQSLEMCSALLKHNIPCHSQTNTSQNCTNDTDSGCKYEKIFSRRLTREIQQTNLSKKFRVSNFRVTNDTFVDEEGHSLLIQGLCKPHLGQSTTITLDTLFHGKSMLTSSIFVTLLALGSSDLKKKVKRLLSRKQRILHGKKTLSKKGEGLKWTSSLYNFDFFRPPTQNHVVAPVTSFLPPVGTSQKNVLSYEGARLVSLNSLPSTCNVSKVRLASAGFYYDTTKTNRNAHNLHEVVCYSCGLSYAKWEDGVNPFAVHRELSPHCSHMKAIEQAACPISSSTASPSETDHVSKKTISAARPDGRPRNYGLMGGNPDFSTTNELKQLQLSADSFVSSGAINVAITDDKNKNTSSFSNSAGQPIYARPEGCGLKRENSSFLNPLEVSIDNSLQTDCEATLPVLQPEPRAVANPESQGASSGVRENGFATVREQADATGGFRYGAPQTSVSDFDDRPPLSSGNAVYPQFATTQSRFATFYGWPLGTIFRPELLVSYGFYFAGYADCIRCFYCGVGLKSWQHDDDVLQEHIRWRPHCGFLLATKGRRFVNDVLASLQHSTNNQAIRDRTGDNQTASVSGVNAVAQQPYVSGTPRQFEKIQNGSAPAYTPTDATTTTTSTSNVNAATLQRVREMGFDEEKIVHVIRELRESGSPIMDVDTLVERLVEKSKENGRENGRRTHTRTQDLSTDGTPDPRSERYQTLKEENERLKERKRCKVCRTATVGMIFLPCGHVVACTQCGAKIRHCTSCGQFVRATANVFLS